MWWRIFLACLLAHSSANAHEGQPLFIEVTALEQQRYQLAWRLPTKLIGLNEPSVSLSLITERKGELACAANDFEFSLLRGISGSHRFVCNNAGTKVSPASYQDILVSEIAIQVRYPRTNPGLTTLLRNVNLSGEVSSRFFPAGITTLNIESPTEPNNNSGLWTYFQQGITHIASGYDHLLFVACLLLIAASWRRLVLCVTGFTIGHSITLGLATFQLVHLPLPAVETSIALSIAFLAAELLRRNRNTLSWRHPIVIAVGFGLLHGFGFASALQEIGLPNDEKFYALLAFNVGVEAGQLLFVVLVTPLFMLAKKQRWPIYKPSGYVIGVLAMFWSLQRLLS